MADELTTTKLNPESHLLLVIYLISSMHSQHPKSQLTIIPREQDQPLLRLPHEVARKNFKTVQKHVERENKDVISALKSTANASLAGQDASKTVASLENMINRMQGLKRKMETLHSEEKALHQASRKRIQHLQDLYEIPSLADVKYDEWSRVRLNRLLVDYLLRCGYGESARALAREKGIEELVDVEVFVQCHRVEESLRRRSTQECLAWCAEHRPMMKKLDVRAILSREGFLNWHEMLTGGILQNRLEFELRLQQYIELRRNGQLVEARQHAQRYLTHHSGISIEEVNRAAGLLAYSPDTQVREYRVSSIP